MTSTTRHREEPSAHPLERHMDEFSEQLVACYDEIAALQDASEALGQLLDRTSIAERSLAMALRTTGATRGAFYSRDENGWERLAVTGDVGRELPEAWESVLGSRPKPLVQNRAQPDALSGFERVAPGFRNFLLAPLPGQEGLAGILALFDVGSEGFESGDAKMVQAIARQAATALSNERHHRKLLQAQEEILVAQKLAAMGEMAAEIGHELNNYIAVISGRADLIPLTIEKGAFDKAIENARTIAEQTSRIQVLTNGLMDSSRRDTRQMNCDLTRLIADTVDFVKPQNKYDKVQFHIDIGQPVPMMRLDPQQMQQVLLNLLSNAADAIGPEREGHIRVRSRWDREADEVVVEVQDDGPGVPGELLQRIFEPSFTTKKHGHGFGLAVCHRVVTNHRGTISVSSNPEWGTVFRIALPAGQGAEGPKGEPEDARAESESPA